MNSNKSTTHSRTDGITPICRQSKTKQASNMEFDKAETHIWMNSSYTLEAILIFKVKPPVSIMKFETDLTQITVIKDNLPYQSKMLLFIRGFCTECRQSLSQVFPIIGAVRGFCYHCDITITHKIGSAELIYDEI